MDKYEKLRVVGRGAYGTVHLCCRLTDRKLVIIKEIPVEQMSKEERQSTLNEVKVLSMLQHPNIIEYYENFLEDRSMMIVMEYAPGGTLYDYLQEREGQLLKEEEVLHLFSQIAFSLHHVHGQKILHRDLKTQNILMNEHHDIVKIGDFGISKILVSKSKAYSVVGTPCYISPELCEGKPYNQKSDVWALGCVLYELLTLQRAFEAATLPALVMKILRGLFAPIASSYSQPMHQLLLSLLHLDPARRPSTNQLLAHPLLIVPIHQLCFEMGKLPCVPKPSWTMASLMPGTEDHMKPELSCKQKLRLSASAYDQLSSPLPKGTVLMWGGSLSGPVQLLFPHINSEVVQVDMGRTHGVGLTKNGMVFFWELARPIPLVNLDEADIQPEINWLEGQSGVNITEVACGDLFLACITDRGMMLTHGNGAAGCLGHGSKENLYHAKIVEALLGFEVVSVACGDCHVVAITSDGEIFSWGQNGRGQLGLGSNVPYTQLPRQISLPEGTWVKRAACGPDSTLLVTADGQLLATGSNRYNKLGLDVYRPEKNEVIEQVEEASLFTAVQSYPLTNAKVQTLHTGSAHTAIVTEDGRLITFGSNQFGQLGHSSTENFNGKPYEVPSFSDSPVAAVACGDSFTAAVDQSGKIFSWGNMARGRLGRGRDGLEVSLPVSCQGKKVLSLASRHSNTVIALSGSN